MTENEARARLESMVQADTDPVLTVEEVNVMLSVAARPDPAGNTPQNVAAAPTWAASTGYVYGDVVTADPAAGRYWMCVNASTSGTTQPSWPDQDGLQPHRATVYDDNLVWLDVGTTWTPTYDLNAGAAHGWGIKAGKAAPRFNFTTDGQTFNRREIYANCLSEERRYRRRIARGV